MTTSDEQDRERRLQWEHAEVWAKRGNLRLMLRFLRQWHDHYEVPDLHFIADLLEGKFKKGKGRPRIEKTAAGLTQLRIARGVCDQVNAGMSVTEAIRRVADDAAMSESSVRQHYEQALSDGIIRRPSRHPRGGIEKPK